MAATTMGPAASVAIAGPRAPNESPSVPASTRPAALPASAQIEMSPLARPRNDVGNSSGPYTPSAGIDAADTMVPISGQNQSGQPSAKKKATVHTVPPT